MNEYGTCPRCGVAYCLHGHTIVGRKVSKVICFNCKRVWYWNNLEHNLLAEAHVPQPKHPLRGALDGLLDNLESLQAGHPADDYTAEDWVNERDTLVEELNAINPRGEV